MAWIANSLPLVKTYVTWCFMSQFPTVSSRNIVSITDSDSKKEKKKDEWGKKYKSLYFSSRNLSPPYQRNSFALCTYFKEEISVLSKQKQHPKIFFFFFKDILFI